MWPNRYCVAILMEISATLLHFLVLCVGFFLCFSPAAVEARFFMNSGVDDVSKDCMLRSSFPKHFMFGTASSAFQYEGAPLEDGKGITVWDSFSHMPGTINDGSNADTAEDQYHRYKEDIQLMASLGVNAYRFSISWARILPEGTGKVNHKGIEHYRDIIDILIEHGITPVVTLFHYDLPQTLQDAYDGWLSPQIIEDFTAYAEICFQEFGDKVKYWITVNEPNLWIPLGYTVGMYPPGRCSITFSSPRRSCFGGKANSTQASIAIHHSLLAHASVVETYRNKYQHKQNGSIGISLTAQWFEPLRDTEADRAATNKIIAFWIQRFVDPFVYGDYPKIIKESVASLPSFSKEQSKKLRRSLDFIGLNYYSTYYVSSIPAPLPEPTQYLYPDADVYLTCHRDGVPIGDETGMLTFYVAPHGIKELTLYITQNYDHIPIFITENGYAEGKDENRIKFHRDHLSYLEKAMREGADVRGYLVWSLLDTFEWSEGYAVKFGLFQVDHATQKRIPKMSADWFQNFLHMNSCHLQTPSKMVFNA